MKGIQWKSWLSAIHDVLPLMSVKLVRIQFKSNNGLYESTVRAAQMQTLWLIIKVWTIKKKRDNLRHTHAQTNYCLYMYRLLVLWLCECLSVLWLQMMICQFHKPKNDQRPNSVLSTNKCMMNWCVRECRHRCRNIFRILKSPLAHRTSSVCIVTIIIYFLFFECLCYTRIATSSDHVHAFVALANYL